MEHLKRFFIRIRDSFYNPKEYVAVRTKSLGDIFGFFFLTGLITSAVVAIPLGIAMVTGVAAAGSATFVDDNYPEGLEVTVKDGIASTNQEEPYMLAVPEKDKPEGGFDYFLVIDTRQDITLETIASYNSAAVLTQKNLIVRGEREERSVPLSSLGNIIVTEALAKEWYGNVMAILKIFVIPVALLLIPIISVFALFGHAVASLVGSVVVMGIGMLRKVKISYGESYKLAMFASVPILIFETLAYTGGFIAVPFWLTLLLFITLIFVNLKPEETPPAVSI